MNTAQNGKGDKPRKVCKRTYDDNYDRIFRSHDEKSDRMRVGDIEDGREYLGNGSWQAVNIEPE